MGADDLGFALASTIRDAARSLADDPLAAGVAPLGQNFAVESTTYKPQTLYWTPKSGPPDKIDSAVTEFAYSVVQFLASSIQ